MAKYASVLFKSRFATLPTRGEEEERSETLSCSIRAVLLSTTAASQELWQQYTTRHFFASSQWAGEERCYKDFKEKKKCISDASCAWSEFSSYRHDCVIVQYLRRKWPVSKQWHLALNSTIGDDCCRIKTHARQQTEWWKLRGGIMGTPRSHLRWFRRLERNLLIF